jgi:hypothetical protein
MEVMIIFGDAGVERSIAETMPLRRNERAR